MPTRRHLLAQALAAPALLAPALLAPALLVSARGAAAGEPEVFQSGGIALGGTDPVAYFTEARPVAGSAGHALGWRGVTWHFASAANLAAFEDDPEAHAPRYGGYCAWAVAQGYLAPTVPEAWSIVDGRLYLNASLGVRRQWERDIPGFIATADGNWPGVLG